MERKRAKKTNQFDDKLSVRFKKCQKNFKIIARKVSLHGGIIMLFISIIYFLKTKLGF